MSQTVHCSRSCRYVSGAATVATTAFVLASASGCCLSNAMYSSIGQNIKPLACPMSVVRCIMSSMRTFNSYPGMNRR